SQRPAGFYAGEHKLALANLRHRLHDGDGAGREWHAVLLAAFHAGSWDNPKLAVQIELLEARASRLAAPDACQDDELQRPGADACVLAQSRHEVRQLSIGQRCIMLVALHLGPGWK